MYYLIILSLEGMYPLMEMFIGNDLLVYSLKIHLLLTQSSEMA